LLLNDYLGGWDLQKKLENFIKTNILQKDPDGISAVETQAYCTRFVNHIADLLDIDGVDFEEDDRLRNEDEIV
jgi:hypothetical protein